MLEKTTPKKEKWAIIHGNFVRMTVKVSLTASFCIRFTVLLPRERNWEQEVKSRIARRMQINEVNMRTAIGSVGGTLAKSLDISVGHLGAELEISDSRAFGKAEAMLHDWGQRVETWAKTKSVADRAIGSLVAEKVRHRNF